VDGCVAWLRAYSRAGAARQQTHKDTFMSIFRLRAWPSRPRWRGVPCLAAHSRQHLRAKAARLREAFRGSRLISTEL